VPRITQENATGYSLTDIICVHNIVSVFL